MNTDYQRDKSSTLANALVLARSTRAKDHQILCGILASELKLEKLDRRTDYINQTPQSLNVSEVLDRLSENASESATDLLVSLTQLETFHSNDARIVLLTEALSKIRPAPKQVIDYWDKYSHSDSIFLHLVIKAICENASHEAIDLLERKLLDTTIEDHTKQIWLLQAVLPNRDRIELLYGTRRWVTDIRLSPALRTVLISVLFDYRPEVWFAPDALKYPPALENTSTKALVELVGIANEVIDEAVITPGQREVIERSLVDINAELSHRK